MSAETEAVFSHRLALKPGADARPATTRTADDETCAAVAAALGIESVGSLSVEARLDTVDDVFRCRGTVRAFVTQACVVSGEPVPQAIEAGFERYLVVGDAPADTTEVEIDPDERDVDHLAEPVVDIGAIALEELALALDPYPRASDADALLAACNDATDEADARRPFAVLAQKGFAS